MPEYLAPAVYVEEIDSGNKPIEGVSTSTAGMIGVTERGPANVPILVTSYGEYVRWFGERLNRADFGDHCYLPHAVEGFFTNGGKRVFITRVEASGAARANFRVARSRRRQFSLHRAAAHRSCRHGHRRKYADLCSRHQYTARERAGERRSNPARR